MALSRPTKQSERSNRFSLTVNRSRLGSVRLSVWAREDFRVGDRTVERHSKTVFLSVQLQTGYRAEWWHPMATAVCGQASQCFRWFYRVPNNDKDLKGQSPLPDTARDGGTRWRLPFVVR
jgi:hypothetical protein